MDTLTIASNDPWVVRGDSPTFETPPISRPESESSWAKKVIQDKKTSKSVKTFKSEKV